MALQRRVLAPRARRPGLPGRLVLHCPNPPFGAVFTYYLGEGYETRRDERWKLEAEAVETEEALEIPTWEELRAEAREKGPRILLTVRDETGQVVRRLTGPTTPGFHRVAWDLRYPPAVPVSLEPPSSGLFSQPPTGPPTVPGAYTVSLAKVIDDQVTPLGEPRTFTSRPLGVAPLTAEERAAVAQFQRRTADLQRAVMGASRVVAETEARIDHLRQALIDTPGAGFELLEDLRAAEERLDDLEIQLDGDPVVADYHEATAPAITDRVFRVIYGQWGASSPPTRTQRESFDAAASAFGEFLAELRTLVESDLAGIEQRLEEAGAPWTPGRFPTWQPPD